MSRQTVNVLQGSDAWHLFRSTHFGASEASAVLCLSPYKTRTQLLNEKKTGLVPEVNAITQKIFDKGHEAEDLARILVEEMLNEEMSPVVYSFGNLSASVDGINFDGNIAWETKQYNAALFEQVNNGELPEIHWPQCQQVLLVTGAEKLFFTISDGTPERTTGIWVEPDAAKQAQIKSAWVQFARDLETHVPTVAIEPPKAQPVLALPALFIHAKGEITTSNMKEYGIALANRMEEIRAITLVTDQDFSNAKAAAKNLRDVIQQAKLVEESMDAGEVGEAKRMIKLWCEDMRLTALQLEKDVEREDALKKQSIILSGASKYSELFEAAELETKPIRLLLPKPDFATAIKGKRNYESMHGGVADLLANATIALDSLARDIRNKQAWLKENADGFQFLFADIQTIIHKQMDDLQMLAKSRIAEHKAAEAAKLEAERARIQAEEETKAREKVAKEAAEIARIEIAEAQRKYEIELSQTDVVETVIMKPVDHIEEPLTMVPSISKQAPIYFAGAHPSVNEIVCALAVAFHADEMLVHKWLLQADFTQYKIAA